MKNRKIFSLALAAALTLSLAACGSKGSSASSSAASVASSAAADAAAVGDLDDLYEQGFTLGVISYSDGVVTANFTNEDHTEFRQAVCNMTQEQCDAFFAIDFMANDYDQQCIDALSACQDLKIITPEMPDPSEYEGYVGKTIGDMEDDGLDFAGSNEDEDGNLVADFYLYTDDDITYTVRVYPEGAEEDEIYDDDAIRELKVERIVFWDFD